MRPKAVEREFAAVAVGITAVTLAWSIGRASRHRIEQVIETAGRVEPEPVRRGRRPSLVDDLQRIRDLGEGIRAGNSDPPRTAVEACIECTGFAHVGEPVPDPGRSHEVDDAVRAGRPPD
jgi:predicted hydrocarbon binding protein